jgi:hypothetical protein
MRFESAMEKLWVSCSEFFMLLGSIILCMVTPLHLVHLDDFTACDSFCCIQNSDWSLTVCQIAS